MAADFDGGRVDVYASAGLGQLRSMPFSVAGARWLIVGLGSRHAVVVGTSEAAWLDLVAGVQLSTVVLPRLDGEYDPNEKHRAVLSEGIDGMRRPASPCGVPSECPQVTDGLEAQQGG